MISGADTTYDAATRMHPPPATAEGRAGALGWALRARALGLLLAGSVGLVPAFFFHGGWHIPLLFLVVWNCAVLALAVWELWRLPRGLRVTRRFGATPALGQPTKVELTLERVWGAGEKRKQSGRVRVVVADGLHASLAPLPLVGEAEVFADGAETIRLVAVPRTRGDFALGAVYCRVRGALGLAERWVKVTPEQRVRVYPAAVRAGSEGEVPLISARQLEMEKRRMRQRGLGREFESLREYQAGDALRDMSWTASARRGRLITRQFTTERSQQVWVVLDAGRLSRTTERMPGLEAAVEVADAVDERKHMRQQLQLQDPTQRRLQFAHNGDEERRRNAAMQLGLAQIDVTQLDQATDAAVLLARAVTGVGDKFGLLAYGRTVRQQLLPGAGAGHLRVLVDLLAQVASERGEANHLRAAARLKQLQRSRSLVIWVTEVAESAGRSEIAAAVAELSRHHLALVLLLEHPELHALAEAPAETVKAMFASAAAREMEERRRALVAELERGGALVVRTTSARLATDGIAKYLEIKARGLL